MTIDYADTNITSDNGDVVVVNDTYIPTGNGSSMIVVSSKDKVHTVAKKVNEKKGVPTISMWAKPSVRSGYSYTWYKFEWVDYCPNCGHYNALLKNPKGVPEREYTCRYCDSDFCAVTGKEKYSWSRVYLRKA